MNSFYGGKQGRTYNIVERFDCVNLNSFDTDFADILIKSDDTVTTENPDGKFKIENLTINTLVKDTENNKYYRIILLPESIDNLFSSSNVLELLLKGMVQEFKKGGSYTDVNYGLYVIIDTIKKLGHYTNDENGLLFRRGLNYSEAASLKPNKNDNLFWTGSGSTRIFIEAKWQNAWSAWVLHVGGGAIYEGQIVGPRGGVGELKGVLWSELIKESLRQEITVDLSQSSSVIDATDSDGIIDYINFGAAEVKEPNGDIVGHKISFKFYKPLIRVQAQQVSPYGRQSLTFQDSVTQDETTWYIDFELPGGSVSPSGDPNYSLIKLSDGSSSHPFYYNYQIAVPHGKKGDSVENLLIVKCDIDTTDLENPIYNIEAPTERQGELKDNYKYLTYKIISYDTNENGTISRNKLIDKYNIIDADEGGIEPKYNTRTVIIDPTSFVDFEIGSLARNSNWSLNIYLICLFKGENPGAIPINDESTPNIGTVKNSGTSTWEAIQIPGSNALIGLEVHFTADSDKIFYFTSIDYFYMDDKGNIYTVYAKNGENSSNDTVKLGNIPILQKITFNDFTGDDNSDGSSKFKMLIIRDGNSSSIEDISTKAINYPVDIQRQGDIIYILYSDPEYRSNIPVNQRKELDYKYKNKNNLTITKKYVYQAYPVSPDMMHVFGDLTSLQEVSLLLRANGLYQTGILNSVNDHTLDDRAGWIITVTTIDENNEKIIDYYAYDYIKGTDTGYYDLYYDGVNLGKTNWYIIQTKTDKVDLTTYYIVDEQDPSSDNPHPVNNNKESSLRENGIWFILR